MTLSVSLRHQFDGFDLDASFLAPRGITVLFGRSGSGKSTIVNAVAGLLRPDQGRISIDDRLLLDTSTGMSLPPHRRRLGYVFQEGRLFPHLNVRQNLTYGRWFASSRANPDQMKAVVDMLGLGHLLDRRPTLLSGGEKQRVAIGRAILSDPAIILADEPLAALDDARKAEILPYFERLRDETSIPVLYVSHSVTEVARLATSVVALQNGRVMAQGAARDVLGDPMVTPLGVQAVGAVLRARVVRQHADGLTELDAAGTSVFVPKVKASTGQQMRLRIAAKEVILSREVPQGLSALNIFEGLVSSVRAGEGPGAIVSVHVGAGTLLARVTQRSVEHLDLRVGVRCYAIVKSVGIGPDDVGGADVQMDTDETL
jgi:molybdate transport system ATP-binding protein